MTIFRILIFTLIPIFLQAQKAKIHWGEEFNLPIKYSRIQLIGENHNNLYFYSNVKKKKKSLLSYNLGTDNFSLNNIEVKYKDEVIKSSKFFQSKDKVLGISFFIYKKEDILEMIVYDFKNGTFEDPRVAYQHDFRKYTKGFAPIAYVPESNDDLDATFFRSQDSTKIVFVNVLSNQDTKKNDKIVVAVFDEDMDLLWDKIQDLPYKDKKFDIEKAIISNEGDDVFLVGKFFAKKRKPDYKIFKITEGDLKEYAIALNEKIEPVALSVVRQENNQSLLLTGLYKLKGKDYIHGVYSGVLNLDKDQNEELNYSKYTKEERRVDLKADFYHFVEPFRLPNGNAQFLAENKFVSNPGSNSSSIEASFYFRDFIFITVNSKGEILENKIITRKIISDNPRTGHSFFRYNDHTFLIFDSQTSSEDKKKYNLKGAKFHQIGKIYCFDENGDIVHKKMLFTSKDKIHFYFDIQPVMHDNWITFIVAKFGLSGIGGSNNEAIIQCGSIDLNNFQ